MTIQLMMLCSNAEMAQAAQHAGVDRIFFDLEYINKRERQRGLNTVISNNNIEDIPGIRCVVGKSELLVRTNPNHAYLNDEIDKAIRYGADSLMLPMTTDAKDAERFSQCIGGRARAIVMVETPQALVRIDKILEVEGVDEVFVGLNDLHLGLGLTFMFEVLSGGIIEYLAEKCHEKKIPYGFGGIARIGDGVLKSETILGEHYRLGSSSVILSRTFKDNVDQDENAENSLKAEVKKVRQMEKQISGWDAVEFEENRKTVAQSVGRIVERFAESKK